VVVANTYGSTTSASASLALDQLPIVYPDTIQRYAGGGVRVHSSFLLLNDTDADGDVLGVYAVSPTSTAGGTLKFDGKWIYYTPPEPAPETDTFTYVVSDGHCGGITPGGTVTVQIKPDDPMPANLTIESSPGAFRLTFDGVPGWTYRLQFTDNLLQPDWQTSASLTADSLGVVEYLDLMSINTPARFYRAVWP
jgi:hypothetical protein